MGVRWYGKGAYDRGEVTTETVKASSLFRARAGQFVFNRIDTQKGAFDVVPASLDGALATNEFPLYTTSADLDVSFLLLYFQQESVLEDIEQARAGSEGRSRWKEADFEAWQIPLPSLAEQRRIVEVMRAVDAHMEALEEEADSAWSSLSFVRDDLLAQAPLVGLASVCALKARLVDPTTIEHRDMVHVGVESIRKNSGRVVGARTAAEDAVTSGKYRFEATDVVFSKIRPALRKVALPGFQGLCSADAYPLSPAPDVPPGLLREALLFEPVVERVVQMSGRTKMPKVNRTELFSIEVPMPEVADRESVDAALGALRQEAEALTIEHERLRDFRAALLSALFTQQVRIPESYDSILDNAVGVSA